MKGPRHVKPGLEPREGDPLQKEMSFSILINGENPELKGINSEFSTRQPMKTRREDLKTCTEILIRAKNEIKPTRLMSDTRLSYTPFMDLINKLLKLGLLEIVPGIERDNRNIAQYRTTDKGRDFVARALICYAMIEDNYIKNLVKKVRSF